MTTSRQRQPRRGATAKQSRRERAPGPQSSGWLAWVDGYWRADGAWVAGYYRSSPRHLAGQVETGSPASLSSR